MGLARTYLKPLADGNKIIPADIVGAGGLTVGNVYFVAPTSASWYDSFEKDLQATLTDQNVTVYATVQAAIDAMADGRGDVLYLAPGAYAEAVTISRSHDAITIIGLGGRGAAYIDPSTEDATGLTVHADDVTLVNVGVAAEDDTAGNKSLVLTGSRFRAYGCKIEGGDEQVRVAPGTVAQEAAGTHGVAGDTLFYDCEFAWGNYGVVVAGTDYGAVTQIRLEKCRFHNLATKHITEAVGSGGSAAVTFRNFVIVECDFDDLEDGTAPTNYIDLNADNGNTGVVTRCSFPTAINSGLNLVSTAMHWVSNYHTGGVSTAQPS